MLGEKVAAAAFVVAVSEYNRRLIRDHASPTDREKVVVIHCGADPMVFAAGAESPVGNEGADASERVQIVCVASLEEVKGHRFLLDACRELADRGVPFCCDLVGDGPLRGAVEDQIERLRLSDSVCVHGALPRPDVRSLLLSADVAVLASHPTRSGKREGIPVALMEAMACGLPVIASALSGIPELVEDGRTGFLIAPGDFATLADRLECLAAAPDLRTSLGEAARATITSQFDLRVGARLLLQSISRAHARRSIATIDAPIEQEQVRRRQSERRAPAPTAEPVEVTLE
jgi:glycosyltransferase involved in cell wall biosynthesis